MSQVLLIVKVDDNLISSDERGIALRNAIFNLKYVKDITLYNPDLKKSNIKYASAMVSASGNSKKDCYEY